MMNKMGDFIALLNIGALSIGYYSKVINNKDIFDGYTKIILCYDGFKEFFSVSLTENLGSKL